MHLIPKKTGELSKHPRWKPPLETTSALEGVSPVQHHIHPVSADAGSAVTVVNVASATNIEIMRRLVATVAQVRRVVPQDTCSHTHARRYEIPKIPLTQQDTVTVELCQVPEGAGGDIQASGRTRNTRTTITTQRHIGALKVGANQDRIRSRGRASKESLGLHRYRSWPIKKLCALFF